MPAAACRAVGEMLARPYHRDEQMTYVEPDAARRERRAPWFFTAILRYSLGGGTVLAADGLAGVAILLPPGGTRPSLRRMTAAGLYQMPLRLGPAASRRLGVFASVSRDLRTLAEPYWYIGGIGVEPARQGEGIGGALMGELLARVDAESGVCSLDTANERNVGWYEGLGFRVADRAQVPAGPTIWSMTRS
ncbi:MAG: GNAT family N-acetyltransferase [Gaiellaceae bacterium]